MAKNNVIQFYNITKLQWLRKVNIGESGQNIYKSLDQHRNNSRNKDQNRLKITE